MKSGSLKLLEPSGTVQACNGIALPSLTLTILSENRGERVTFLGNGSGSSSSSSSSSSSTMNHTFWF